MNTCIVDNANLDLLGAADERARARVARVALDHPAILPDVPNRGSRCVACRCIFVAMMRPGADVELGGHELWTIERAASSPALYADCGQVGNSPSTVMKGRHANANNGGTAHSHR